MLVFNLNFRKGINEKVLSEAFEFYSASLEQENKKSSSSNNHLMIIMT